jgi:hypothetical protein
MSNELKTMDAQLPDFMRAEKPDGLEMLKQYIRPARMKILQKSSSSELLQVFDVGQPIVTPVNVALAGMIMDKNGKKSTGVSEKFYIAPLFFFPEWLTINPIQMRGKLPFIRSRTTDPKSRIAAMSRNQDTRMEICPEEPQYSIRHVEVLNFIVVPITSPDNPLGGTQMVMSFSKAEHKTGSLFASLIQMRKAHLYGCQFEVFTSGPDQGRKNDKGEWWGYNISNPSEGSGVAPFCQDKARYDALQNAYNDLKAAHAASRIIVDHDDEVEDAPADSKEF